MTFAILTIGTSEKRINLLNNWGFHVQDWRPVALDHVGTWQESPLSAGRREVFYKDTNSIDKFTLALRQRSQDQAIYDTQELRRMLRAGIDYWLPGDRGMSPVYLEARADCETNSRYAVVRDARLVEDDNPYAQPFTGPAYTAMQDLSLVVEHSAWTDQIPGNTSCVQISGLQAWEAAQTTISATSAANTDDGYITIATISLATGGVVFGSFPATENYESFFRFVNVNVPQGSRIIAARIDFEAAATDVGTVCHAAILGEDADNPATFSTMANYYSRTFTTAYTDWPDIPAWTAANTYSTPDLSGIVQEIVDRPGWVANQAMAFFVNNAKSDSGAYRRPYAFDDPVGRTPTLYISYATLGDFGRDETCGAEVYVANKHNRAQLTHAYYFDASLAAWSGNLIGAATPFEFFPNPVGNNDICYFGIDTTLVNSGPFASIVFDIGTAAVFTGDAHIGWEYWNGAWVTLATQDNTADPVDTVLSFAQTGVNSVHWTQPANWATVAVNGVTGYWVRAKFTLAAGGMITPTQDNRDFYTIVWPWVDIAADQVGGDVPAWAHLRVENESDPGGDGRQVDRLLLGLRSASRGENFTPFLNFADEQNPNNTFLSLGTVANDATTPTGRRATWTPGAPATMARRATLMIQNPLTAEYAGSYHAYLRARQQGGAAGNITVQLAFYTGEGAQPFLTPIRAFTVVSQWQLLDFGRVTLPPDNLQDLDLEYILIDARAATTVGGGELLYLYDLILFPVDEGAWEFQSQARGDASASTNAYTRLNIDSATYPKAMIRAYDEWSPDSYWSGLHLPWRAHAPGPLFLQANRAQRLWFLAGYLSSDDEYSPGEIAWRVQLFKLQRYSSMRGAS